MKKIYFLTFLSILLGAQFAHVQAQLTGGNAFLQGRWLEIGELNNGAFGTCTSPAGYHGHTSVGTTTMPSPATGALAEVYDIGHDGWTVGAQVGMGDYTYPGYPFEGWSLQIGTARMVAFQGTGCPGTYANGGTATGAWCTGSITGYSNSGGRITGTWSGTAAGTISIRQETRVDTLASWVVVTTVLKNTGGALSDSIYYARSTDPDNDETWTGGSFTTNNQIDYQNDIDHRVQVRATGVLATGAGAHSNLCLCTKDCRAVAYIYNSWPFSTATNLADFWYKNTSTSGGSYYGVHTNYSGDIGIGLVYKIGRIPAGDSAVVSYAYTFNGINGIDSAFPEPLLVVGGVGIPPSGPAPAPTYDTFNACGTGISVLPVRIDFASDKCWTWSSWTWSPSTGLASTTGVTNTINIGSLPPIITYTITGTDSNVDMYSCNQRVMYLTIKTCNGAIANSPCEGDTLRFNAPGDSTAATYAWYGPAPSTTVINTNQTFFIFPCSMSDTGTYHVIKTVAGVPDTSVVHVTISPLPTVPLPLSICAGGTTTLTATPPGGTWVSSNPPVASIDPSSGVVVAGALGSTTMTYTSPAGCKSSTTVTVVNLSPITGVTTMCVGQTTTLSNPAPGGTWSSGNLAVATAGVSSGVIYGVSAGDAPITYAVAGGCRATTTVTVNPNVAITGPTSLCQRWETITLSDAITGGTWSTLTPTIATVTPTTGVVYGVTPGPAGTATIQYTNPFGCTTQTNITVNPTPAPPGVTDQRYCQYATPIPALVATGVAGATFTWYGPGVTAGYPTAPSPSSAVPGVDTYYVTQTSPAGCVSDSARQRDSIIAKPATPMTTDTSYCQYFGAPAPLSTQVSGTTGGLNWYIGGVSLGTTSPVPSTAVPTYPAGTTWYVSQTVNGCEGDSAAVNVDIVYLPEFEINTRPWVCQFDSMTMAYLTTGPALVNGTYLWSLPPGATFVNGTTATDPSVMVKFDTVSTNNYVYLTASNLNGQCSTTDTIRIQVIEIPTATAYSKANVCMSDTVSLALSARSVSAQDFVWYVDSYPLSSSPALTIVSANSNSGGPYSITWNDTGIHIIHVQAIAEHGCTSMPTADTIEVHALPDATFGYKTYGQSLCLEDSVYFYANDSNYQNLFWWTPEHYFKNLGKHSIWGSVQNEESIVTLTVTDPFGCVASMSQTLNPAVCCNVPFPNSFTPNGDGLNDVFRPIPMKEYHRYHIFRIVNRWGQTVFETTTNKIEWDGTMNGVPQDMGVYYWYLKFDCGGKTIEEKGDCTLIR